MDNRFRATKAICHLAIFVFLSVISNAQIKSSDWPVLKTYDQDHIQKIKMPVGGIGTGTVSLKGNGAIQDWEIMNRPAKGFNPWLFKRPPVNCAPFFAIYLKEENKKGQAVLLEGPPTNLDYEGNIGAVGTNHGLPRFEEASFQTAYPFGQVKLEDNSLPVKVTVGAFQSHNWGNMQYRIKGIDREENKVFLGEGGWQLQRSHGG